LRVVNSDSSANGGYALSAVNHSGDTWRPAIYGESKGGSAGVYGRSDGWHATVGYQASSDESLAGVWGHNSGIGPGVYGDSPGPGAGVKGESNTGEGVYGTSADGVGVYGTSTTSFGVYGSSTNDDGVGGVAFSEDAVGVRGGNLGGGDGVLGTVLGGDSNSGVHGIGWNGYGLYGEANGPSGVGVYGQGGADGLAAVFRGNVQVRSASTGDPIIELGEGLDYAEGFDVSDSAQIGPGTVLIIDPAHPGELTMSETAYDRKVAGIVTGANGLGSGVRLGSSEFDHDVALAGRVYCNVDAAYGDVVPGDLLTTSPTPGYAMVVNDHSRARGAILGKAMEGLPEGEAGQILVLVTLQ
jgi:hypothetical protein